MPEHSEQYNTSSSFRDAYLTLDELTYKVRNCIFTVAKELRLGFLESIYTAALLYELKLAGLTANAEVELPVPYKDTILELGFRLDIIVQNQVILEVKSVETLNNVHKKQLLNYLKLTGMKVGFLINFNVDYLEDRVNLIRIVN